MHTSKSILSNDLLHQIFGSSRYSIVINTVIIFIGSLLILYFIVRPIIKIILDVLDFRYLQKQDYTFLEITPPSRTIKSTLATSELFSVVYGLCSIKSKKNRLLGHKNIMSFEVYSTRKVGIRFVVRLPKSKRHSFEQQVASYLPDSQFRITKDYLPTKFSSGQSVGLMEFTETSSFAHPLANKDTLSQHDPIAYLTGSMTQLEPNELISFQIIVSPASRHRVSKIQNKLINGRATNMQRKPWHYPFILLFKLLQFAMAVFRAIFEMIGEVVNGSSNTTALYHYTLGLLQTI